MRFLCGLFVFLLEIVVDVGFNIMKLIERRGVNSLIQQFKYC